LKSPFVRDTFFLFIFFYIPPDRAAGFLPVFEKWELFLDQSLPIFSSLALEPLSQFFFSPPPISFLARPQVPRSGGATSVRNSLFPPSGMLIASLPPL